MGGRLSPEPATPVMLGDEARTVSLSLRIARTS